ncbi:hemerythrin domain-containing protein [Kitasatospora sp. NPDC057904]|uniref:hemerythrin domain-containing protein n=1 Tax=unclassified Kitasatospora TaxID=2633591 RepID=UPI0036656D5A
MSTEFQLDDQGRITAATSFLLVHHALRRDAERLPRALAALDPRDTAQAALLNDRWRLFEWVLADHSENEDASLFPLALSRAPELAEPLDGIEQEHEELDARLKEIGRLMADLTTPEAVATARAATERLAGLLGRHLDREEKHIVPVLVDRIRPEELAGGQGKGGPGAGPGAGPGKGGPGGGPGRAGQGGPGAGEPPRWLVSTWTEEDVDPVVVDALIAALPPAFAEQMAGALPGWREQYRDLNARVWAQI